MLARVCRGSGDAEGYVKAQDRALDLQRSLLTMLRSELPETLTAARAKAAGVCHELAEHYKRCRKFDKARRSAEGEGGGRGLGGEGAWGEGR